MSKKEMIHPTHFLVPTVLGTPRTKTKGLNFFGSIKIGMGAHFFGSEEIRDYSVVSTDLSEYSPGFNRTQKNLRRLFFCVTRVSGWHK
jgi:hypothetical protein